MEDSFLPNLLKQIQGQEIDVITGGQSWQSFSLAGRRKKHLRNLNHIYEEN